MRALSPQFNPETSDFVKSGTGRVVMQANTPEGDLEVTFMDFTGNKTGLLQAQLEELASSGKSYGDLSRVKVYTSIDGKLAFNVFNFEKAGNKPGKKDGSAAGLPDYAAHIGRYAKMLKAAHESGQDHPDGIKWSPLFDDASLVSRLS